jgi:acyl carrier protein
MTDRQTVKNVVAKRLEARLPRLTEEPDFEEKDLRDYAEFDSLSILEFLVWVEGEFSVRIPDEQLIVENFSSVTKIVDYVMAHR